MTTALAFSHAFIVTVCTFNNITIDHHSKPFTMKDADQKNLDQLVRVYARA